MGGGAYSKSCIYEEIHNNVPNFTFTPVTKTEQETGFVSPFYLRLEIKMKFQYIVTETQRNFAKTTFKFKFKVHLPQIHDYNTELDIQL